jgi:hypothetical protein
MKIRPVEAELFNADGHDEVIVAFRNFANKSKMYEKHSVKHLV